jgi:hypothetical protein
MTDPSWTCDIAIRMILTHKRDDRKQNKLEPDGKRKRKWYGKIEGVTSTYPGLV